MVKEACSEKVWMKYGNGPSYSMRCMTPGSLHYAVNAKLWEVQQLLAIILRAVNPNPNRKQ
jgi:hypothetical protein